MTEVAFVVSLITIGASLYAILLWGMEARSMWMSRLSARGVLKGHYTPYTGSGWGSPRWMIRQRIAIADLVRVQRLATEPDDDRTTELWRLRSLRRKRLGFAFGPAWLVGPFAIAGLFDALGGLRAILILGACALAAAWPASLLYRRARDWGNVADFGDLPSG